MIKSANSAPSAVKSLNDLDKLPIKTKRHLNRPAWKHICEEQTKTILELEKEIERLRANGADKTDIARIKAESFAAGVAAASAHFQK